MRSTTSIACRLLTLALGLLCTLLGPGLAAEPDAANSSAPSIDWLVGNYVGANDFLRAEGYDWVEISIRKKNDVQAYIQVRSHPDNKRATCSLNGTGWLLDPHTLITENRGVRFQLSFANQKVTISVAGGSGENVPTCCCSGRETLAGTYSRQDATQLQPDGFTKLLASRGITFQIATTIDLPLSTLTIQPDGLASDNSMVLHQFEGTVIDAEVMDLNADGWPEVVAYIQSDDEEVRGSVIAYSVDGGKSMGPVAFPDLGDDPEVTAGYMGHDWFSLDPPYLSRGFLLFDEYGNSTGLARLIRYKMLYTGARRAFEIVGAMEMPIPPTWQQPPAAPELPREREVVPVCYP